jgi:hypothetical protein
MNFLPKLTVCAALLAATALQAQAAETNGLYYASSGEKVDIKILQAHVYSENNANADFSVRLDNVTNLVTLRIGGHEYACSGWGGSPKDTINVVWFKAHGRDEAETIAQWFSVTCDLRSPPGYKLYAQFVPSKTEFNTNEPMTVKFQLKNLDDRTVIFQRGGQQRGYRDNQYGFRAQFSDQTIWRQAVPDIGDSINFGGLSGFVPLDSGKMFEDQIDLKKWFAFDKPGAYAIHGFYRLDFHRPPLDNQTGMPWNEIWSDYASADFTVVVK